MPIIPSKMATGVDTKPPLSPAAALVLVLAGGAMPFASSADEEAQRWLRILRLHGDAGHALQALGVGEQPLIPASAMPAGLARRSPLGREAVALVAARARGWAADHGAGRVGTPELLMAVMEAYGELFGAALRARGTSAAELLDRVAERSRTT